MPRPKTYGSVKNLEKKGLIKILQGNPERYSANSPTEVLFPIVKTMMQDAEACKNTVEKLTLSYEASKYISPEKYPESFDHWIIKGRVNVHKKISEMIDKAQDYIYIITSANGIIRAYKAFSNLLEKAQEAKVDIKVITSLTTENKSAIQEFEEILKIKANKNILPKYILVDGKKIMFIDANPDDPNTNEGEDIGSLTNDPFLAQMHRKFFLMTWEKIT